MLKNGRNYFFIFIQRPKYLALYLLSSVSGNLGHSAFKLWIFSIGKNCAACQEIFPGDAEVVAISVVVGISWAM